jgi:hypothetical protein
MTPGKGYGWIVRKIDIGMFPACALESGGVGKMPGVQTMVGWQLCAALCPAPGGEGSKAACTPLFSSKLPSFCSFLTLFCSIIQNWQSIFAWVHRLVAGV